MTPAKTSLKSELALLQTLFRKFFWIWICLEVQENKKKVILLCSRPLQNVKLGIIMTYSCSDGKKKKKKKKKNRHKNVMYEQSCCFIAFLPFRLPSLSSLLKLPIIFGFILATQARNNFFVCFFCVWVRRRNGRGKDLNILPWQCKI